MKSGLHVAKAVLRGGLVAVALTGACGSLGWAQEAEPTAQESASQPAAPAYKPKFTGDPAHSDAEAGALGYLRTVMNAQKLYKRKHDTYASSLAGLVHTGSFTQRMTKTDRGEYYVSFQSTGKGKGFDLTLTPKQYDAAHRSFFSDETGAIRVETDKVATDGSPRLK